MKKLLLVLFIMLSIISFSNTIQCDITLKICYTYDATLTNMSKLYDATVVRVVDGDTVVLNYNNKEVKARLLGIDTPETVHPTKPLQFYGKEASNFVKSTLHYNKNIKIEFDEDKEDYFGRLLVYIWLDKDTMLNYLLVRNGFATAYTKYPFKYKESFVIAENRANKEKIGIWGKYLPLSE